MKDFIKEFRNVLQESETRLQEISEVDSAKRQSPGKWSAREVVGHLIDSAINNHRRFVNGQLADKLVFSGYDQDKWVALQQYQDEAWHNLIALWKSLNLHIVHVVEQIPPAALAKPHSVHNFDKIAWKTVDKETPVTLEYLIRDYLAHMQHHLNQIYKAAIGR